MTVPRARDDRVIRREGVAGRRRVAFTVVELMVAIGVLTLIVLVLYGMFDQTQRALRGNVAQVDVMEGGRAAMELLTRELAQMEASQVLSNVNFYVGLSVPPTVQRLPNDELRFNALQDAYFVTRSNNIWTATAYRILSSTNTATTGPARYKPALPVLGLGWLGKTTYTTNRYTYQRFDPFRALMQSTPTNLLRFQKVVDGVVHFRIVPLDSAGQPFAIRTNFYSGVVKVPDIAPGHTAAWFTNAALPGFLDIELAVLEPQVMERLKAMPTHRARTNFLAQQASHIHLFQQRIPIRNAGTLLPYP